MSDVLLDLFAMGADAKSKAYAPYSNHPVGSALRTVTGQVFSGCNVETANYKGTCAEAGSITAMIRAGEKLIQDIAVVGPGKHLCTPCGDCRQRIREFACASTGIHVFDNEGNLMKSYTVEELLPDSFGPENLVEVAKPASPML